MAAKHKANISTSTLITADTPLAADQFLLFGPCSQSAAGVAMREAMAYTNYFAARRRFFRLG
jgi:hypothetical protein